MNKIYICFFLLVLGGCATTQQFVLSEDVDQEQLATLYVYRTDVAFASLDPEKPFIYLDDKVIAKLGTGHAKLVEVPAGNYRLSVRQSFLFMPSSESDYFMFEFVAGETYYLRYHYGFSNAVFVAGNVAMTGTSDFHMTTKENYINKR
ncbi:MAG: hypothetical protein Alis3KO_36010 [Aliiglaciecola sp.]